MRRIQPLLSLAIIATTTAQGDQSKPTQKRRLSASTNIFDTASKAELFAHWTADKINSAIPLDLKIDPRSGEGFVVRRDELVSYANMFAATKQEIAADGDATLVKLSKVLDEEVLEEEMEGMHVKKNRLGARHKHERVLEASIGHVINLATIEFGSDASLDEEERRLQTNRTNAHGFATHRKSSKKSKKQKVKEDGKNSKDKKDKGKLGKVNEGGPKKKKKFLPKINDLTPSRGDKISSSQTFSAKVTPSTFTGANIRDVSFRLVDPAGETSDWLPVPRGYDKDMYEITIEGFGAFPASKWKYQMSVKDDEGRSIESPNIMFKVDGEAEDKFEMEYDDWTYEEEEDAQGFVDGADKKEDLMEFDVVGDSNWPYGGGIQSATGRILFEFNGSGTYVCSGTVVKDGKNGRSVILTAAHCAYNDSMKKFATKAIFIPDQVDTKGSKSDFNCANDKYGCWILSFAVVSKGWASNSFPENVEYDYAFYVVMDGQNAHTNGYSSGLSGTLDLDVVPMNIDFGSNPVDDFAVALGYSANKDPAFRYCTNDISTIKGVPWYTNLWIDRCGMTGGASGGSWLVDMNTDGVGTIVSVNSWGFTDKVGMAGPKLQTESGSFAECLFVEAKNANDPGHVGGYIVDC
jgi:hypothetical protein